MNCECGGPVDLSSLVRAETELVVVVDDGRGRFVEDTEIVQEESKTTNNDSTTKKMRSGVRVRCAFAYSWKQAVNALSGTTFHYNKSSISLSLPSLCSSGW